MSQPSQVLYEFGRYSLDPAQQLLYEGTKTVPLTPKAFQTLLVLVEAQGRVVGKDELLQKVWPDTFVEESTLAQNIFTLRKQLQGDNAELRYIETVPKRGYRFVANVRLEESGHTLKQLLTPDVPQLPLRGTIDPAITTDAASSQRRTLSTWAGLLLVILVSASIFLALRYLFPAATPQRPTLAVLPVQNLTGDTSRDYVADGLTEELIANLGSMGSEKLAVIARTSSMSYKHTSKTVAQIGQELGADYVLECSFRERPESPQGNTAQSGPNRTPQEIRFTAQLIRVRDQTHLWTQDYDESQSDIVAMEDRISLAAMDQIRIRLTTEVQERATRAHAVDPIAHDLYLKGRYAQSTRSRQGLHESVEYFQQAIERDPRNAAAYAGLADSLNLQNFYGFSPGSGTILNAQNAAAKAIQLDDFLAEGHAAMAYVNFMWLWDWPVAEREFQRAIQLNPNYVPAHHWYALYLTAMGRKAESLNEIKLAQKLDPVSPIVNTAVGYVYFFHRDYDEAIRQCKAVLQRNPDFVVAFTVSGRAYDAKGMHNEAIADLERVVQLSEGGPALYLANLGHAYATAGRTDDAKKILDKLNDQAKQGLFVGPSAKALVYAGLGDKENAILYLQHAYEQNDANRIWIGVEPAFDGIRSDPRVQAILRHP